MARVTMIVLLLLAAHVAPASMPAKAQSNAARYLIDEEIAAACEGRGGRIDPAAVVERDLTGDRRPDLIISHEGISCTGGGQSSFCGQLCSINIYVRRGPLLKIEREMLGRGVSIGNGGVPPIHMLGAGGRQGTVKWNGQTFQ